MIIGFIFINVMNILSFQEKPAYFDFSKNPV